MIHFRSCLCASFALLSLASCSGTAVKNDSDAAVPAKPSAIASRGEETFLVEVLNKSPQDAAILKKVKEDLKSEILEKAYLLTAVDGNEVFKMAPVDAPAEPGSIKVCRFYPAEKLSQLTKTAEGKRLTRLTITLKPRLDDGRRSFGLGMKRYEHGKWIPNGEAGLFTVPSDIQLARGIKDASDEDFTNEIRETVVRTSMK